MGKTIDQLAYHIEWLEPGELKPYSANSKLHSEKNVANIANSIARYGWQQNVTITKDKEIIIGHGRQLAALRLGVKVPCKVIEDDLTEDDIRELRIADNLTHDGEYDWEAMNAEIEQFGLEFEGFDFDFGDGIEEEQVEEPEPGEVEEDDFEEELPEEPKVKLGDLYLVGRHRILCGDSTMLGDVERLMDGAKADMLLTDPPYNVDYNAKEARLMKYRVNERFSDGKQVNIKNDAMDDDSFRQFLADAFSNADMVMKPGAAFYIWNPVMQTYNFLGALRDMGWHMKQILVWVKNNFTIGKADYQWKHENCIYGWKLGAEHLWASDRKQTSVINWNKPLKNDIHPTMKPIGLFDYCIRNNTKGGDIVLDLFGGSCTTIMACEQDGRIGYCVELEPKYVQAAIQRFIKFTGKGNEVFLIRDGKKIPCADMFGDE